MKKINFKKVFSGRNAVFSLLILAVVFLFGHSAAAAGFGEWAGNVVGGIIGVFIRAVAAILILLVGVLMDVASYSDFIHAAAIAKGWIVVRDVCNMFFVVVLLIIAFATILGQEEYGAKKMLPKLIMAAVLINFSKMFCGLMIDVASVVMLTFVNAFSAIGAGNILDLLGITTITKVDPSATVSFSTIVSAYIFGLIYVLIATVVVASMLGMLVMRIVRIWILTVLSPLAFFLQAVPGKGQQYASKWWSEWTSNLIVGPVIAFFLWLSFAALQVNTNPIQNSGTADTENKTLNSDVTSNATSTGGLGSEAGTTAQMAKFVIAIGMLLGGMKIAQEVGGETGSALGQGMAAISKGKAMAISGAKSAAKGTGKLAGRAGLGIVSQADRGIGKLAGVTGDKRSTWAGKLAKGWGDDLQATAKKDRKAAAAKYLGKLGMGEKTAIAGQEVIGSQGFQTTANVVKGGAIGAVTGMATMGPAGALVGLLTAITAGYASSKRGSAQERIKNFKNVEGDYSQAQADYDKTQREYQGHSKFVDEFDENTKRVAELEASKPKFGPRSQKDQKEYDEKSQFINDAGNKQKYQTSSDYLTNNAGVLQDKKQAVFNAENVLNNSKKQNDSDKNYVKNTGFLDRLASVKAAMADMTKEKAAAKTRIKSQAMDPEYWLDKNASRCPTTGLRKSDKEELDVLNQDGVDSDKAANNIVNSIDRMSGRIAQEWAKAIAVFEDGGAKLNPNLQKIKAGLQNKTTNKFNDKTGTNYEFNSDAWKGKATANYKSLDDTMKLNPGSGGIEYQTFARNKDSKEPSKDIMGASFEKINQKAGKTLLDTAAGANQNVDGDKLKELGTVMSSLIDDEIAALKRTGAGANSSELSDLMAAKNRLSTEKLSGLSLKNTDVSYNNRADEYNSTQHEIMHQAGAKNEEAVYAGADALQNAKLIGRNPESGQRYDETLGKMIASMESSSSTSEAISQAIADQVGKWSVPKAQIVYETENGKRDDVSSAVLRASEPASENSGEVVAAIDKLSNSLNKPASGGAVNVFNKQTIAEKEFFRVMFDSLKKTITKDDKKIATPLEAMASFEKNKKNI